MRVLFLTNNPHLGSTARILQNWLLLGQERDVRGSVVLQRSGELADWLSEQRFPYCIDPMPWPDRRRPWTSLWHAWRVARWATRNGAEVIHCNEHDVLPFAQVLRRLLGLPIVCHVRFVITRAFAEWMCRGTSRRAPEAVLWTSYQQQRDCADAVAGLVPEGRQHVIRLGMDLSRFGQLAHEREATRSAWNIANNEIVVGTASPLRPRKRVEDFVQLVARLAPRHPRLVGVIAGGEIVGDEAYRGQISRQIEQTRLGRRLRWLGNLEPVEPFYHACDIVVSTSEYETFGNSVCEAMACRRPVVGYEGGSVREVLGDAGVVVDTGDLDALTAAVDQLIQAPDLRQQLGDRARQRVADSFDPAVSFQQLQQIYTSL